MSLKDFLDGTFVPAAVLIGVLNVMLAGMNYAGSMQATGPLPAPAVHVVVGVVVLFAAYVDGRFGGEADA